MTWSPNGPDPVCSSVFPGLGGADRELDQPQGGPLVQPEPGGKAGPGPLGVELWSTPSAVVSNQNSVAEVEDLLRKQAQLQEDLDAHLEPLEELQDLAQEMIQQEHYDTDTVRTKSRALALRLGLGLALPVSTGSSQGF